MVVERRRTTSAKDTGMDLLAVGETWCTYGAKTGDAGKCQKYDWILALSTKRERVI
jgi:hypothetical protein